LGSPFDGGFQVDVAAEAAAHRWKVHAAAFLAGSHAASHCLSYDLVDLFIWHLLCLEDFIDTPMGASGSQLNLGFQYPYGDLVIDQSFQCIGRKLLVAPTADDPFAKTFRRHNWNEKDVIPNLAAALLIRHLLLACEAMEGSSTTEGGDNLFSVDHYHWLLSPFRTAERPKATTSNPYSSAIEILCRRSSWSTGSAAGGMVSIVFIVLKELVGTAHHRQF
jgi:hypothetical protein